ncbi:hypothetical protein MHK_006072, partial [Candidatus Magnetomorum sp. HK-1]
KNSLNRGISVQELAKSHHIPEPLIWHIALEKMTDQERFKALNWGLDSISNLSKTEYLEFFRSF